MLSTVSDDGSTPSGSLIDEIVREGTFLQVSAAQFPHYQQTKNLVVSYSPKKLGFFQSLKSVRLKGFVALRAARRDGLSP
ncbi:hypothetical protein [Streptomyces sp. NPDC086010]|uniref:hypothetical protein n=1 Tax=Streptomyces sp. NPDC086010 TaxID=3365745 RepID=UPI0037D78D94